MKRSRRDTSLACEQLEPRIALSANTLTAITGDWNGDGRASSGLYDSATGQVYLRNENSPGFPDLSFRLHAPDSGSVVITGDWDGDGVTTLGWFDPGSSSFWISNQNQASSPFQLAWSGQPRGTAIALAGDWDGDGRDTPALLDPTNIRLTVADSVSPGVPSTFSTHQIASATLAGLQLRSAAAFGILAGDWDGDGRDTLAMFDRVRAVTLLSNTLSASRVDAVFPLPDNPAVLQLVSGDWNGTGKDTLGYFNPATLNFALPEVAARGSAWKKFFLVPAVEAGPTAPTESLVTAAAVAARPQISAAEIAQLLDRAAAASASQDAIIAIVDRQGRILGVRAEAGVLSTLDTATLVYAIDGAIAEARTGALFANGDPTNGTSGTVGPLTSRTVRFISQSTITQREVESNPNIKDPNSTIRGPGFVAPIGVGGHFPPGIQNTPSADLFEIEHTNRDSIKHPGLDSIKGTADDIPLPSRFNVPKAYIPAGQELAPPESYGFVSGRMPDAQSRGIGTLPGGIPLYKDINGDGRGDTLMGGIGVFFPGPKGYATYEQGFVAGIGQSAQQRTNASRVIEAEWIAFAAAGGSVGGGAAVGTLSGVARVPGYDLPFGRIDLAGITLEIYGPNPGGVQTLLQKGAQVGRGSPSSGANQVVDPGPDRNPATAADNVYVRAGQAVPEGWLVLPHAGGSLTSADVQRIINQGITEANLDRSAIRLPIGSRTRMTLAVADKDGNVLGLYRMQDATVFSIDVAVAKARNTAYYADPNQLQTIDMVDDNRDGKADLPRGVAFTNRTFRYLAQPFFPEGIDGTVPGPFSILRDPGINPKTAENLGPALPASRYTGVVSFDAFHPGRNFRDPSNIANQNGVVFFPGSTPLYKGSVLVGGLGVSGDGVDQDDVVTYSASVGYQTPTSLRADQYFVRGVRLPFQKFPRNPRG